MVLKFAARVQAVRGARICVASQPCRAAARILNQQGGVNHCEEEGQALHQQGGGERVNHCEEEGQALHQ